MWRDCLQVGRSRSTSSLHHHLLSHTPWWRHVVPPPIDGCVYLYLALSAAFFSLLMLWIARTMTLASGSNPVSCSSDANVCSPGGLDVRHKSIEREPKREWGTHPFRLSLLSQPKGRQRHVFEKSCKLSVCTDLFHYDFIGGFTLDILVCILLVAILLGILDTCDDVLMLSNASRRLQLYIHIIWCIHVCIYLSPYIYETYKYVHKYTCAYICNVILYTYIRTYMYDIHVELYACIIYVCIRSSINVHACVCQVCAHDLCICLHMCIYKCVCIYVPRVEGIGTEVIGNEVWHITWWRTRNVLSG